MMDIEVLKKELIRDEGLIMSVYRDKFGYKTVGVGHLIRMSDPEFSLPVGARITAERVLQLLNQDITIAQNELKKVFNNFDRFSLELQNILVNMMFNVGASKFSKFRMFIKAIENRDYKSAAKEMRASLWFGQVPLRAGRLIERMKSL